MPHDPAPSSNHPPISPADPLLAAALVLPATPVIACVRFTPQSTSTDAIELARRHIHATSASAPTLLDAVLTSVHLGPEPFLYAFKIATQHTAYAETEHLATLPLDGLTVAERSVFTPPPSLLPNPDKRAVISYFYDAVRARVIDDIVTNSTSSSGSVKRQIKRFKNGFLMSQISPTSDWQYKAITRPLIFCQLQIHFSYTSDGTPSQLLVHPILLPTPFLDIAPSLPLPSGSPITLLPYGTPAYYLSSYTGPTTGLIKQFQASLQGLGAGQWANASKSSTEYPFPYTNTSTAPNGSPQSPTFIIGWIKVENKQGEDKGITIIYPTHLCLSYVPSSSTRAPLDYIPELPAPLQPSPQVAPALPSMSNVSQGPIAPQAHRPAILSSPTSESLHSFRALTLSKTSDLRQVATEVGGYVDAVAKERERERERLKREREYGISTSPKLSRTNATTPAAVSAPTPVSVSEASSSASTHLVGSLPSSSIGVDHSHMNAMAGPSSQHHSRSHLHPQLPPPPPQMAPSTSHQNFYPSPPHGSPLAIATMDNAGRTSPAIDGPSSATNPSSMSGPSRDLLSASMPPETPTSGSMPIVIHGPPSAAVEHTSASVPSSSTHGTIAPPPPTASSGYDLYGMDGSSAGYMDLGMDTDFGMGDFGLSFGMGMGDMNMGMGMGSMSEMGGMGMEGMDIDMSTLGSAPSGGAASSRNGGGMEFEEAITDDDFSFFDRPARPPAPAPPPHTNFAGHARSVSGTSAGGMGVSASVGVDGMLTPHAMGFADELEHGGGAAAQGAQHMWTPGLMTPFHGSDHEMGHGSVDDGGGSGGGGGDGIYAAAVGGGGSVSEPATPGVHLSSSSFSIHGHGHALGTPSSHDSASLFEPIPFAEYHRRTDGKYANGKFALALGVGLPSPPASEQDAAECWQLGQGYKSLPASPGNGRVIALYRGSGVMGHGAAGTTTTTTTTGGLKVRYDAVTDPRIGVVKMLIGVKRKPGPGQPHGTRDPQRTMPWASASAAHEDWETPLYVKTGEAAAEEDGVQSEVDSDEDEDEDDAEEDEEEDPDTPLLSRPATPPPSYLPLGPALLHTHFEHALLLPLSTPLRPPGASILPAPLGGIGGGPGTVHQSSVPTPVSPAATMGAANEKSKSLESAAGVVAAEVVANPVWAETWRASAGGGGARMAAKVWKSDGRAVRCLLEGVKGLRTGLSLGEVFGLGSGDRPLQALEAPMISIGKGDAIIQVLPTAIRFWEKLGLDPKGGSKDVSAFVLFEDDGEQRSTLVENWVGNLCSTYQGKHFGSMTLGSSTACMKDGLVPLKFDASFRKSLTSFFVNLTPQQATQVFFIVLPITVMSLSSPVLRQILSVTKKILSTYRSSQILFQFVPEQHLFSSLERTSGCTSALDELAFSVYDRILVPVDHLRSRRVHLDEDSRRYFMDPCFTLARPRYNKVTYVRSAHASLDVLDRYTLLHVGYHLTACGKWIIAVCVDQRGEAYETGIWLTQSPGEREHEGDGPEMSAEEYAVRKVWRFAMQFAKKADVEWRVVYARLGVMSEKELHAWTGYLHAHVSSSREHPVLHHSLVCVVPDASWTFTSPKSSNSTTSNPPRMNTQPRSVPQTKQPSQQVFTDVSAMTYAIFPTNRIPISVPPSTSDLGLSQSFVHEPFSPMSSSPSSPHSHSHAGGMIDTLYPPVQSVATPTASSPMSSESSPSLPHPITILPQHTSYLIRVPNASSSSDVTTTAIHFLCTFHSASQGHGPQPPNDRALLDELTRNYYELAVLAKVRFRLDGIGGHRGLPCHLAAVDAVRVALDRDWDRLESVVDV